MHITGLHKLTTCFLFLLIPSLAFAQNMYSALHLNDEREYKTTRPKKITETTIFYGAIHNEKRKSIETFDAAGMILTEDRFDDDNKLILQRTLTNDTTNRVILSSFSESTNAFGLQKTRVDYIYDSRHFLVQILYKNQKGIVFEHYGLLNNEHGNPVELTGFAADGSTYGKETASYLYDKNKVITSVIKPDGTVLTTDTMTFNFKKGILTPDEGSTYNPQGDLTSWIRKDIKGNKTYYEATYTYDNRGNCTREITYKIITKPNGKRKQQIYSDIKKEYVY